LVVSDGLRVRQVLINLIGNAIKFTDAGSVRVSLKRVDAGGSTAVLLFEVQDSGIGFDPSQTEHLFTAFAQADHSTTRRFGGTGLGLAISRELLRLLGGPIDCTSRPGVGSTFWFTVTARVVQEAAATSQPGDVEAALDDSLRRL